MEASWRDWVGGGGIVSTGSLVGSGSSNSGTTAAGSATGSSASNLPKVGGTSTSSGTHRSSRSIGFMLGIIGVSLSLV